MPWKSAAVCALACGRSQLGYTVARRPVPTFYREQSSAAAHETGPPCDRGLFWSVDDVFAGPRTRASTLCACVSPPSLTLDVCFSTFRRIRGNLSCLLHFVGTDFRLYLWETASEPESSFLFALVDSKVEAAAANSHSPDRGCPLVVNGLTLNDLLFQSVNGFLLLWLC